MATSVARRVRLGFDDTTADPASPGFADHGFSDEISSQLNRSAGQARPGQWADLVGDLKRILQWNILIPSAGRLWNCVYRLHNMSCRNAEGVDELIWLAGVRHLPHRQ
jgi:hypothetical protein